MNILDVGILILVLALALVGAARGLAASGLALAGFVAGALLGSRLAPLLLGEADERTLGPLIAVFAGLLLGACLAVVLEGIGARLRRRIHSVAPGRVVDGLGGALLFAALGLVVVWALAAVALSSRGPGTDEIRRLAERSRVVELLNDTLPSSAPLVDALRRVSPIPTVRGPDPDVPPPAPSSVDSERIRAASRSVVSITGVACGLGVSGSGWVAADGLVVTNAHVVAGETETLVRTADGRELSAELVHFEPRNDLALLRVEGLDVAPLGLADDPARGRSGAVAGFPENGPLTVVPARLGTTATVASQDSYGRGPIERRMTAFRAEVRPGNSGGPVLDSAGEVMATVFAASEEAGPPSGLGIPNEVVAAALAGPLEPVESRRCAA